MRLVFVLGLPLALAACVSPAERVIVDTRGVDMMRYEADQRECMEFVKKVPVGKQVAKKVLLSGGSAGAIGAIVGAWTGDAGRAAATGIGIGVATAGPKEAERGWQEQRQVMKRCMEKSGYTVLN